eukprot:g16719.t2
MARRSAGTCSRCWYLQQVASNVDASLLEKRCRAFVRIFPHVLADECLAFPHSMIPLQMGSKNCGHLLVANGPCNTTLEQYFLECQDNRDKVLEELLPRVGEKLAKTLDKYRSNELIQLKPSGALPKGVFCTTPNGRSSRLRILLGEMRAVMGHWAAVYDWISRCFS